MGGEGDPGAARPSRLGRLTIALSQPFTRRGIYLGRRSARAHVAIYRAGGGRLGAHVPGWPAARIALVHHVGARTGKHRVSPLVYLEDGDAIAIVASKAGQPTNPAWFHNLRAHPETEVEIGAERRAVRARPADRAERKSLWPRFDAAYPEYANYREQAAPREIPILLLEPRAGPGHPPDAVDRS
ncbi:MAG TPA: nitroreductase/quinone reductase family protein [Solirubrobacterales bacterium]|nr:nitroreductase/quinone reductase family protein [Solirubrobacterales bacterium]